jgi:hypothetical protein
MTNDSRVRGRPDREQADGASTRRGDRARHDRASDPPGAVSNQNGEEGQSGLRPDGTHPEPRTDDQPDEPERSSS